MIERTEATTKVVLDNGNVVDVTVLSGITIDDLVVQGMKAEGYRVITKRDAFPAVGRDLRDYLLRLKVLF